MYITVGFVGGAGAGGDGDLLRRFDPKGWKLEK